VSQYVLGTTSRRDSKGNLFSETFSVDDSIRKEMIDRALGTGNTDRCGSAEIVDEVLRTVAERKLSLAERRTELDRRLRSLQDEQRRATKGRSGPPSDEEREELTRLAAQGRKLTDQDSALRAERDALLLMWG
jgi:uncharacterized protein (DUF3084 family)